MKAYILSIAGAVLLSAIVTVISPNGKMGKFVKGSTRLLILFVMLSPMISWVKGKPVTLADPASVGTDENYLAACAALLEREDEEEIAAFLEERFSLTGEIDVERAQTANFPRRKITVILGGDGIIAEDERIYMISQVREALETRYAVETEVL